MDDLGVYLPLTQEMDDLGVYFSLTQEMDDLGVYLPLAVAAYSHQVTHRWL